MARVFISYSREDIDFARRLCDSLVEAEVGVWFDVKDIQAGIKWSTAIQEALQQCDVMILVVSSDSMSSSNVEDEWQYFLDSQKPVIPVLLRPTAKHFQLNRLQHVDFHTQSYDYALSELLRELELRTATLSRSSDDQGPIVEKLLERARQRPIRELDAKIADYSEVIHLAPQLIEAYVKRGNALKGKNKLKEAIVDYDKALELEPAQAEILVLRALAKFDMEDYEGAIADYTQALELDPTDDTYYKRGLAYVYMSQYDKGIDDYTSAITINGRYEKAYYYRGKAKERKGDKEGAISDYQRVLEIEPDYIWATERLQDLLKQDSE